MQIIIRKSFVKDISKISDNAEIPAILECIKFTGETNRISEIKNIKKLSGGISCYRIRVGKYRLGVIIKGSTIEFIRAVPRKDIYKVFP